MKKNKALVAALAVAVALTANTAYASYGDVSSSAVYYEAIQRLNSLGIMRDTDDGKFHPDAPATREQLAQTIVTAAGHGDIAASLKGTSVFSDVEADRWSVGYINAAIQEGYLTGLADGKFHPEEPVTFAQAATVILKALGYTAEDIPGIWPYSHIEKLKALKIPEGISLDSGDSVPRWAFAVMTDKMLDTPTKDGAGATLAEAVGFTGDGIYSIYSRPEVVTSTDYWSTQKIGSISINSSLRIVRNTIDNTTEPVTNKTGEAIGMNMIKINDVVYQVSSQWTEDRYILVIDHKVTGKITGILPDKYKPQTIQIDQIDYELGQYFNTSKLGANAGAFEIGQNVTLLLGYDAKAVDVVAPSGSDNLDYAVVQSYTQEKSTQPGDYGSSTYTATLLTAGGATLTARVGDNPSAQKGRLVKYSRIDSETISIQPVAYSYSPSVHLDRDQRYLGDDYVSDSVRIFNLVSNNSGADAQVSLVKWTDLPSGELDSQKILHISKSGAFEDVTLLLLKDIFEQEYKQAIILDSTKTSTSEEKDGYAYSFLIDGQKYSFTHYSDRERYKEGDAVKVRLEEGVITQVEGTVTEPIEAGGIKAADDQRIRTDRGTYWYKEGIAIYQMDTRGNYTPVGTDSLMSKNYSKVRIYLDRPVKNGGKVAIMVIYQ